MGEPQPGFDDGVGVERHGLDALLDEPLGKVGVVGVPLPADPDVIAGAAACVDVCREHLQRRRVAFVESREPSSSTRWSFLHPFCCSLDDRLDRFYLANTVGQPTEKAVAVSRLIFAGVLDRHPALKLVVAYGGGYLPTAIGRSDHAWRVRPDAQGCAHATST